MKQYHDLLKDILDNGIKTEDRTGVGTLKVFGRQLRFNLQEGFPIVTTKKIIWDTVIWELAWFLSGNTNVKFLNDHGIKIWDAWSDENGELGPVYGKQWRDFGGIDQIKEVIHSIKTNPQSRRHIVSAWNPPEIPNCALPPCHCFFQFNVRGGFLDLQIFVRSQDSMVGWPYNCAEYALLCHLIAKETGYEVGELVYTTGDTHLYLNHIDEVELLLTREPYPLPQLELACGIDNLTPSGAKLINYKYHPFIKVPIAI